MKPLNKKSMLSLAAMIVLGTAGCGGGSSSSNSDTTTQVDATEVVKGVVNLATTSANSAPARKAQARTKANTNVDCGTSASVQLYLVDDVDYEDPLLKEPLKVDPNTCEFDVTDQDFKDSKNAGADKKYIIRTIVKDGDKTIELAATKLKAGTDAGTVDPVATMIKERFAVAIKEVQDNMQKLTSLGVTSDAIDEAINAIVQDFEKNLDSTVQDLKDDIAKGKVKIDVTLFETSATISDSLTKNKEREKKQQEIAVKLDQSSAADTFNMLDSSVKQQQLDHITITQDTLRKGLDEGLATIKYGIVESFVKMGLLVHDGYGNIIAYLPVDESRKGELPGVMYQLDYKTSDGQTASLGDEYAIRLIDPKKDLALVNGDEDWYRKYLEYQDTVIPASIVDSMIINKDHEITMKKLGTTLDKVMGGDGTQDRLQKLYGTQMADDVKTSVANLIGNYKDELIKRSFEEVMWDEIDTLIQNSDQNKTLVRDKILELPFIAQENEDNVSFEKRMAENPEVSSYVIDKVGATLANGIPVSDNDKNVLQFSSGVQVSADSKMKPMASVAIVDLFMEANGGDNQGKAQVTFVKQPLDQVFGWLLDENDNSFNNKYIWMLDFGDENGQVAGNNNDQNNQTSNNAKAKKGQALNNNSSNDMSQDIQDSTQALITMMKTITGDKNLRVERSFKTTMQSFVSMINKIDQKQVKSQDFGFENEFKGDFVSFNNQPTADATVSFIINNVDGSIFSLENGQKLILAPTFTNTETFERKTFYDLNVSLSQDSLEKFVAANNDLKVYNPDFRFDENGNEDETGIYQPNADFDLILVNADNTIQTIATFPIFPGKNELQHPIVYDSSMSYYGDIQSATAMGADNMGGMFVEHNYLQESGDVTFPRITTTDGKYVGEVLFHYDPATKTFTKALNAGKLSDANMTITMLYKNYDDDGLNPVLLNDAISLTDGIGAGAYFEIVLSGPQIKTQTLNLNILYVGDNGEVEYELTKENDGMEVDGSIDDMNSYQNGQDFNGNTSQMPNMDMSALYPKPSMIKEGDEGQPFNATSLDGMVLYGADVNFGVNDNGSMTPYVAIEKYEFSESTIYTTTVSGHHQDPQDDTYDESYTFENGNLTIIGEDEYVDHIKIDKTFNDGNIILLQVQDGSMTRPVYVFKNQADAQTYADDVARAQANLYQ
ncbi:diguanylate cyclase/phosphodiesterase (GGDEF & EAL domains) with PAS/PAC sensor(s) [hydrothermal vent metagenome]|uniref:Diguanylate cyclase/phosphodiesterase (GGDEF & EAL domains) with PAS/PAC sensor(S) n=1 Tax=hydrothermal vent metagenome TaxID=652676 RepID=A0A1W1D327_9ZZZZ